MARLSATEAEELGRRWSALVGAGRPSSRGPPSSPGACGARWAAHIAGDDAPQRGYRPVALCGRIASMRLRMSRPLGSQFDSRLAGADGRAVHRGRATVPASPFLRCQGRGRVKRAPALIGRSTVQRSSLAYHIRAPFLRPIWLRWPEHLSYRVVWRCSLAPACSRIASNCRCVGAKSASGDVCACDIVCS